MRKTILFLSWLLAAGVCFSAADSKPVMKIAVIDMPEKSAPKNILPRERTIFRCGDTKGRAEEAPDDSRRTQNLLIYNDGDVWMINQTVRIGRYVRDPEKDMTFKASIFQRKELGDLEFGREREFMDSRKASVKNVELHGSGYECREVTIGGSTVKLYQYTLTKKPAIVELVEGGNVVQAYRYLNYQESIPASRELFTVPGDVAILNAGLAPDRPYIPPTTEQKMWALAAGGMPTEMNKGRHDLLGGMELTPENTKGQKGLLKVLWKVERREDLLKTLQWLEFGGHREDFITMGRMLAKMSPAELAAYKAGKSGDSATTNRIEILMAHIDDYDRRSLLGWDMARYMALCGSGYIAGYISEDEAWQRIMPAARVLQKTFSSWEGLGKNFLVGREFWSIKQTQNTGLDARAAFSKLCLDSSSPWRKIDWKTDISPAKESATPQKP